jgi:hypothetical protein
MNVMYVISETPPEGVSTETFEAADNFFWGVVNCVLADNMIDAYLRLKTGKEVWKPLSLSLEILTPAVSCTSSGNADCIISYDIQFTAYDN